MTTLRTRFRLGIEHLEDRSVPAVGGGYTASGLLSEYFANNSLSGAPSFTRHDVRIDFNWGTSLAPGGSTGKGSIGDGRCRLTTMANQISHRVGSAPLMSDNRTDDFFRLFGDANGDARVNATDLTLFRAALGSISGANSYRNYFDFNNDGRVDNLDFIAFRANLGREI